MVDFSSNFGQHVAERLSEEKIIWLTTVDGKDYPQTRPVWFLWQGKTILIFSRPEGFKVKHVENNPKVSLNLDGDGQGGDIVVLLGKAEISKESIPEYQFERYFEKYEQGMKRLGLTPEEFSKLYSVALVVTITALRGQ